MMTTLLRIDRFQARRTLATFFDVSMGVDLELRHLSALKSHVCHSKHR